MSRSLLFLLSTCATASALTLLEEGCYLAYCNAHPDLQNTYCNSGTCAGSGHAELCKSHWNTSGKNEGRVPNPDVCIDHKCLDDGETTSATHQFNATWPPVVYGNGSVLLNFEHNLDKDKVRIKIVDGDTAGCEEDVIQDPLEPTHASVFLPASCFAEDHSNFTLSFWKATSCTPNPTYSEAKSYSIRKLQKYNDVTQKFCYDVTVDNFVVLINDPDGELTNPTELSIRKNLTRPSIQVWSEDYLNDHEKSVFTTGHTYLNAEKYEIVWFAVPNCSKLQVDPNAYLTVTNIEDETTGRPKTTIGFTDVSNTSTTEVNLENADPEWIQIRATPTDDRCFVKVVLDNKSNAEKLCVTFKIEGIQTLNPVLARRLRVTDEPIKHTYGITTRRTHGSLDDDDWTDCEQAKLYALLAMLFALVLLIWKCVQTWGGRSWCYQQRTEYVHAGPQQVVHAGPQSTLR